MSLMMVFIMTAIITYINTGYDADYLSRWVKSFVLAWPFAFSVILVFGQKVQKLSVQLCNKD